jgi:hypothetical protein
MGCTVSNTCSILKAGLVAARVPMTSQKRRQLAREIANRAADMTGSRQQAQPRRSSICAA